MVDLLSDTYLTFQSFNYEPNEGYSRNVSIKLDMYVSVVDMYVSVVDMYVSVVGMYVSVVDMYVSVVDMYSFLFQVVLR